MSRTVARSWIRRITARLLAVVLLVVGLATLDRQEPPASAALSAEPAAVSTSQIGVTPPPMGWASWNTFSASIDYNVIKQQADALVSSGTGRRRATSTSTSTRAGGRAPATRTATSSSTRTEWPGGMKAIADYIHSKGLKAGIYTDAGKDGCGYYFPTSRPAAPEHRQRGPLRAGPVVLPALGLRLRQGRLVRRRRGGPRRRRRRTSRSRAANEAATAVTGRKLVLSFCNWGTGLTLELGHRPRRPVAHQPRRLLHGETPGLTKMYRQLRRGPPPRRPAHRLLQRPRHADGRPERHDRRTQPAAHEPVGDLRRPAAGRQQRRHDEHRDPRHPHQPRGPRRRPGPARPAGRQGRRGHPELAGVRQGALRHGQARGDAVQPHRLRREHDRPLGRPRPDERLRHRTQRLDPHQRRIARHRATPPPSRRTTPSC